MQRKIISNIQQEAQKEIIEKVEARFGIIDKGKRRILNSILEKLWRRLLIDRVIVQDTESKDIKILLAEPEEVKKATDEYYKDQFKVYKYQFDCIIEEWEKEYNPKKRKKKKRSSNRSYWATINKLTNRTYKFKTRDSNTRGKRVLNRSLVPRSIKLEKNNSKKNCK